MVKEAHKDLKRKVNLQEEVRRNDRSFSTWKEMKDLKKMKLRAKDELLKSKNYERSDKEISKV